ncbi:MAG: 1-acyl-sn-glycerol-3-phosphate acyltransferase [Deltaproteobacteria bacterium]|nr:1-acyl-sn-glycerol-3-phosphate acyltransferase [Deltaproteobacteria bacterium]
MAQSSIETVNARPAPRGLAWGLTHWWRNFLGLFPLVGLLAAGVLVTPIPFLLSPDRAGKVVGNGMFRLWARWILRVFGVRVWVKGAHNIDPASNCVIVSNHRSHLDVPCIGVTLPYNLATLHKRSLEYVPLLGQALWMSRSIGLDRSDKAGAQRRLKLVAQRLSTGRSILVFAEGRRSRGPALEPFKKGAFLIALEQHCPIQPVSILGADAVYAPGHVMIRRGDILVVVHPPVDTRGMTLDDRDTLTRAVQDTVAGAFTAGPVAPAALVGATRVI